MKNTLGVAVSPRSMSAWPLHDESPKTQGSRLSGATTSDWNKSPEYHTATFQITSNRSSNATTDPRRRSSVSTTKSQLRQSNQKLATILQTIHTELTTHRTIMLDIQSRVSCLEQNSYINEMMADTPSHLKRTSEECQTWWQACQSFAENCSTPFNANDFFKTPDRFSGFDFHFGNLEAGSTISTLSPWTDVDANIEPALSSTLSKEHPVEVEILKKYDSALDQAEIQPSVSETNYIDNGNDIIERVMVFDKARIPVPPLLQTPPRGKSALILPSHIAAFPKPSTRSGSIVSVENITALPQLPPKTEEIVTPARDSGSILQLFKFKAFCKSRTVGRDHHMSLYFHEEAQAGNNSNDAKIYGPKIGWRTSRFL